MAKLKSMRSAPNLLKKKNQLLISAKFSTKRRKIFWKKAETTTCPLHPGPEKIEYIHLVEGRIGIIYFNDNGNVEHTCTLDQSTKTLEVVPAFTWHTYVILEKYAVTYETMNGVYDPLTWKRLAPWATLENSPDFEKQRDTYLSLFKDN